MNAGRRTLLHAMAAGAWAVLPAAALGAPARLRLLGVLGQGDGSSAGGRLPAIWKELDGLGFAEGRDFVVQVWAAKARKLTVPECAAALVRAKPDLILTQNTPNTRALQQATRTIPIVTGVGDPVGAGFAASLARPGGNITGVAYSDPEGALKLLELARVLIPRLSSAVLLVEDTYTLVPELLQRMQAQVTNAGVTSRIVFVDSMPAVERLFRAMRERGERLAIVGDVEVGGRENIALIARSAVRNQVALVSNYNHWVTEGGLLSHSPEHRNEYRRLASQMALILRGANPATMPFELPDASEIFVNRTTAAKLGIRIPPEVLIAATEIVG